MTAPAGAVRARRLGSHRRWAAALGLVVLAAVGVRLVALATIAPDVPAFGDARAYHLLGRHLADGEGYVRPFDLERNQERVATAEYPPGLPALLAGAELVGIGSEDGQRGLLTLVGGLTVALVGVAGRRLAGGAAGLAAAGLAAVHPALWGADTTLMAEPLAACFGAAALVAALAVHDAPTRWRWAVLGLVLGVGALCRAELLVLGPLLVVPLAWRSPGTRRTRLVGAGVALGLLVAVLAPWTARNALTFHRFVPVSNNLGSVARGANCDLAYQGPFRGLWVTNVADVGGDTVDPAGRCFTGFPIRPGVDEAAAAAELRADGVAYAREHAADLPGVAAARLGRTLGLYRFEQQTAFAGVEGRDVEWERRGTRLFQLLAVIGALGLVAPWRRARPVWVLLAPIAAVVATVIVTYGNLRFRALAEPAVVLLAVVAVADLVARSARRGVGPEPGEPSGAA